ncbi:MAG: hypothetical protein A3A96_00585 [Candidatus Zambryskibacteria bacterium RIFCSPLOWO2_01_FULL_39_39]|uniref:Aminotransferase DegT n=1 Tax=Candidatus Zambryskibacteria bacterium RIFCSPLOWO2_01_FULL_39_39 TaxID=1802758 RepID=A0A1G2TXM0_9BACT|nr:MAG: DegT/DnrJ/EryC1/StrS aminotransferase [Parcubacteria group bacterium GW2011_GWA1_38_7]OHA87795.1 MAG: hypothetical protein A2644_01310 [Candidatus Zambryskibacteria bacterium RIFCSPHIGHO2_01_FULL_39_63]OHA94980.1 MAG: hypothetical protein A3B88_01205 [Candidatus Zambryskibacteria bacterium RIFCSPHIGHO2_02_FULL_39_19]OHA99161.1 MAG: hypothetical protein A3F20_03155 [Candidatus Zambryskibacteria bacterium RIFCSPHIGHO2_12_FULL_39_21]OHB01923.1 MAG: hypothetical protein A3A96_00585 [Candida
MKNIPLFWPQQFKHEWLESLNNVFNTRWLGQGPLVEEFEKKFGEKFNYKYCLALNSGTSALDLAYHLIGIDKGDEVITTCFTCTATNIPLVRRGARLVFADINENLVIDYADVEKRVTPKTKAIVAVTLGGIPIDKKIFRLAKSLNIPVVIDAAQSLGVSESYGDYVCYSFQAIKHFTTGDGGMLILRNKNNYKRAKKLRWFGIDREAKRKRGWNCLINHKTAMEIEEAGYKYHMNDIAAAVGLVGLKHTDEILDYRRDLCDYYTVGMPEDIRCVYGGSYWLFAIITEQRDGLIEYLRKNGIECDIVQLRNDIFKVFGGKRQNLPKMNELEKKYMYLPLNSKITRNDIDFIKKTIIQWKNKKI